VRVKELDAPIADLPVVLLGNKTDLEKERCVSNEDAKHKAGKWHYDYLETSAKDGTGITEAFELLVQKMWRQAQQKKDPVKENPDAPTKDPSKPKKDPKKTTNKNKNKKKKNTYNKRKAYKKAKKNHGSGNCILI